MITGCATIRPAKPAMSSDFGSGETTVHKVAVLPVDLTVQTKGQPPRNPELDRELLRRGVRALVAGLQKRGYPVGALVGPDGTATTVDHRSFGVVIHPTDLTALRVRLHEVTRGYHTGALRREAARHPELAGKVRLIEAGIDPALARSLAELTGTDASLYTRAWAYVVPGDSTGATVAKVFLVLLAIVAVVGVLAALFGGIGGKKGKRRGRRSRSVRRSRRSSGGFGRSRRSGGGGRAAARVFAALGRVAVRAAAASATARHVGPPPPCHSCPPPPPPPATPDSPGPWEDPYGAAERPVPPPQRPAPATTSRASQRPLALRMMPGVAPRRSTVGMAMSLVHHKTGKVLWHVEQRVPLLLEGAGDVERLVEHFLRTLPARR